jgi:hypothetical protein
MPLIAKTVPETLKRLGEECIEDLMFLYDSKSKNKEKQNLLTIYLNNFSSGTKIEKLLNQGYLIQRKHLTQRGNNPLFKYLLNNEVKLEYFEFEKDDVKSIVYQILTSQSHLKFDVLKKIKEEKILMYNNKKTIVQEMWTMNSLDPGHYSERDFIHETFNALSELVLNQQLKIEHITQMENSDKMKILFSKYHYGMSYMNDKIAQVYLNEIKEVEKKYFDNLLESPIEKKNTKKTKI